MILEMLILSMLSTKLSECFITSNPIGESWLFSKRLILDLFYVRICWYQLCLFVRTHVSVRLFLH